MGGIPEQLWGFGQVVAMILLGSNILAFIAGVKGEYYKIHQILRGYAKQDLIEWKGETSSTEADTSSNCDQERSSTRATEASQQPFTIRRVSGTTGLMAGAESGDGYRVTL